MCEKEKKTYSEDWIFNEKVVTNSDKEIIIRLIAEKKNILLTGDRRRGKTSLLTWMTKYLDDSEKVIIFDFHSEIKESKHLSKVIRVGYKEDADIKGDATKLEVKSLIEKALVLPYNRIIADEVYGKGTENLLDSIHEGRSLIFSLTNDTAINALKFVYLSTIYPEGKYLPPDKAEKIAKTFDYAITLGNRTIIEEIHIENGELVFKQIN